MIKLKSLLNEYISGDLVSLKHYLNMTNRQQKLQLVSSNSYLLNEFAKQYFDPQIKKYIKSMLSGGHEEYEVIEDFEKKYPNEFIDFLDWSYGQLANGINGLINPIPTWYVMHYQSFIKNQWLIHFSDRASNIWKDQTFKYGVSDFDSLGYTSQFTDEYKKSGGFNFAYDIIDFAKHGRSSYRDKSWKYGKEAVLFKSSGIKAFHHGDDEPQVIFEGKSAHDIVYLKNLSEGDWGVVNSKLNKIIYRTDNLSTLVKWVIDNFDQYKKVLLPN